MFSESMLTLLWRTPPDHRMMTSRVSAVCSIAGKQIDGRVGRPTVQAATDTCDAMRKPSATKKIDAFAVRAAAQEALQATEAATEVVKEAADRLTIYGQSLPGTAVQIGLARRHTISLINSDARSSRSLSTGLCARSFL